MAKPKLALIPASQGTKLYSVLPADGVGDFTFSRNSAATRINKDGLIETVAVGKSRLNYPLIDGVVNGCPSHLLEPERLQKIQYSEDFSNAYWTKSNTTLTSGFVSPDGTSNAFKLVENTSIGTHKNRVAAGLSAGVQYTLSVFAKKGERNWFWLNDVSNSKVYFDLENGVIGTVSNADDYSITEMKDGWYKCTMTSTMVGVGQFGIYLADGDNSSSYTGDGTSGFYIYGAQLEQGSYPTSYIPNYGTSAGITRSEEVAYGAGDASTFNDSEGVLMAEISALADDGTDRVLGVSDGSANNRIILYYNSSNNLVAQVYSISNNLQSTITVTDFDITNFSKASIKYDTNSIKLYLNGFLRESKSIATAPINLSELAFDNGVGGADFYGNTKQIQYFDSALNDSDLEKITSWTSFTDLANGQQYSIK